MADDVDYLVCTECGNETDVTAQSVYDQFAKTKKGEYRRRKTYVPGLMDLMASWKCSRCLTRAEEEMGLDPG